MRNGLLSPIILLFATLASKPALADTSCQTQPFSAWLDSVRKEALASGIKASTLEAGLRGIAFDPSIVARDRAQGVFSQTFLEFSNRMVSGYRLSQGQAKIKSNAAMFARLEQQYGVPAPIIVAFWGLETDFGAVMGKLPTLRSVATLAYDCRRSAMFREELFAALRIIDRGDLSPSQMIGPWAGELGQMQFLPSYYDKYGVDFDGDGRRDLIRSDQDALASTANFLKELGWQRGQPWLQEVKVPADMPWENADFNIQLPRSKWVGWGVTSVDGKPLPADDMPAALVLPMGRLGPAFLAYPNFQVYLKWNQSGVYATTAAYFATRLAGAGPVQRGNGPVDPLSGAQIKQLQQLLAKAGQNVGEIDGKFGSATRAGVRAMQLKFGMPADGYPTKDLLARLQAAS